jgi:hypothetical protein
MEIKGKNILITGANRGIGRAVAKKLAEDHCHMHLLVRKQDSVLEKEILDAGAASVKLWVGDLSSQSQIEKFYSEIKDTPIDILFNNAGILTGGLLEEQPIDDIYKMLQVNVNALIHLTQLFLPSMLARKKGKIINHSSVTGYMHFPCASTYAAAKSAVIAFTNSLRLELHGTGVSTLLLITPGIKTRMFDEIEVKYGKNISLTSNAAIPPQKYASMIREAILEDLPVLEPGLNIAGVGVRLARFAKPAFDFVALKTFRR